MNTRQVPACGVSCRCSFMRYFDRSRSWRDWLFLKAAARRTERGARCLRTDLVDWTSRVSELPHWCALHADFSRGNARGGGYARATPTVRSSGWKTLKWGGLTRSSVPEGPATVRALRLSSVLPPIHPPNPLARAPPWPSHRRPSFPSGPRGAPARRNNVTTSEIR